MKALGVILLEIGLWERVDTLDRGALASGTNIEPQAVKAQLLLHVSQRLGFYAGEQYQSVVQKCLDDSFVSTNGSHSGDANLQMRFAKEVTQVLERFLDDI